MPPLTFIVRCAYCGAVLDVIPADDPGGWHAAVLWGHVAQIAHAKECRERRRA